MNNKLLVAPTIGVIIAIFVLLLLNPFRIIQAGEVGVVTQFGRVTGRELQPGLSVIAPWQAVWVADTRVQKEQADAAAASNDLQEVRSTVALNYHLDRTKVFDLYNNVGEDFKGRIVDPSIQEAIKATTAKYNVAELLTKRNEVKEDAKKVLTDRLAQYGILVDDLSIVDFSFSDEFNSAIEQKQVAQQQAEQAQYALDAAKKNAEAQAVQKDTLTDQILRQQAIIKWDGHLPQYVGGGDSVFNIPLK